MVESFLNYYASLKPLSPFHDGLSPQFFLVGLAVVVVSFLVYAWLAYRRFDRRWSWVLILSRGLLLLTLLSCLFPRVQKIQLNHEKQLITKGVVEVFLDDSESVSAESWEHFNDVLNQRLSLYGRVTRVTRLSELEVESIRNGRTALFPSLTRWLSERRGRDVFVFTDGGDQFPESVPGELRSLANWTNSENAQQILAVVDAMSEETENLSLRLAEVPKIFFQNRPQKITLGVGRSSDLRDNVASYQIHGMSGKQFLSSATVHFAAGEGEVLVEMVLPPLEKGSYPLKFELSTLENERVVLDNSVRSQIDVVSDTVGVLHLLGSPSWDGRFFRRYIKDEPKFDIISFFILRDPFDAQVVPEEDLALIQFPVDQLFTTELPSFKLIVMQSFALSSYLRPDYQKNLISYVASGGSLLVIGGPKSFTQLELSSPDIRKVLPFARSGSELGRRARFNPDRRFRVEPAQVKTLDAGSPLRVALENLGTLFAQNKHLGEMVLSGAHEFLQTDFNKETSEVLLWGVDVSTRERFPLVVYSFPEKGRAVWVMTDQLWRLAVSVGEVQSRVLYNDLMNAFAHWLLRDAWLRPFSVSQVRLEKSAIPRQGRANSSRDGKPLFSMRIEGDGVNVLRLPDHLWTREIFVCGESITADAIEIEFYDPNGMEIQATLKIPQDQKKLLDDGCDFQLTIKSPSIGEEKFSGSVPWISPVSDRANVSFSTELKNWMKNAGHSYLPWPQMQSTSTTSTTAWTDSARSQREESAVLLDEILRRRYGAELEALEAESRQPSDQFYDSSSQTVFQLRPYWLLEMPAWLILLVALSLGEIAVRRSWI